MPFKSALGAVAVFQFVRELTKPWKETDAYKLGIIDDKGNVLKKSKDRDTREEKSAFTLYHRLIYNTKKMLQSLPGGDSKIKTYASAAWLLKENQDELSAHLMDVFDRYEHKHANALIEEVTGNPTNISQGVAKKDMPLGKKKKKEDDDMPDDTSIMNLRAKIEEGKMIKKVVRGGKVMKKVKCPDGQINKGGKCVPATSQDKQRFVKAAKKRKRKLAGKSTTAATRKRGKSNRKRKSFA